MSTTAKKTVDAVRRRCKQIFEVLGPGSYSTTFMSGLVVPQPKLQMLMQRETSKPRLCSAHIDTLHLLSRGLVLCLHIPSHGEPPRLLQSWMEFR